MEQLIEDLKESINKLLDFKTNQEECLDLVIDLKQKTIEVLGDSLFTGSFTDLECVVFNITHSIYCKYGNSSIDRYREYLNAAKEIIVRIKNEEIFIDFDHYYKSVHTIGNALSTVVFYADNSNKKFLKEALKNMIPEEERYTFIGYIYEE